MAFVLKRGARWYVGYRDESCNQRRERCAAKTKTEAQRMADALELRADRVRMGLEQPFRADMTFEEAAKLCVAAKPADFASLDSLTGRFKRINKHLGRKFLRAVTPADVKAMLNANADLSAQTREHLRVAVQSVFTFVIEDLRRSELENPAKGFKVPIPKRRPLYLTRDQLARLFAEIRQPWRNAFAFALGTGVRKGELLALRKTDVNLEDMTVTVSRSHDRDTTKAGKDRLVPIPLWLIGPLQEQMRTKGPLLFPNPEGKQWSRTVRLHDRIASAMRRAKLIDEHGEPLPHRWKDLRSSWATHAAATTGDIRFVQKVLGHGDLKVTDRYAFALPEHMQTQTNRVDLGSPLGVAKGDRMEIEVTESKPAQLEGKGEQPDGKR